MILRLASLACAIACAHLLGCTSGRHAYSDALPAKNVSIQTVTVADSSFSSVRARVDVYAVDGQCRPEYLGTVELDRPAVSIGIPVERWSHMVVEFHSVGFLGGRQGRISRNLSLKPRAGYRYEIEAMYRDELYNVVLRERAPAGGARELPLSGVASWQPEQVPQRSG